MVSNKELSLIRQKNLIGISVREDHMCNFLPNSAICFFIGRLSFFLCYLTKGLEAKSVCKYKPVYRDVCHLVLLSFSHLGKLKEKSF